VQLMSFQIINLTTSQISKVEFKSNPDFSNIAFDNYKGQTLVIFKVEVDQNPQMICGNSYEANYADRIEVQ
jgi:hypothetical protein